MSTELVLLRSIAQVTYQSGNLGLEFSVPNFLSDLVQLFCDRFLKGANLLILLRTINVITVDDAACIHERENMSRG